jgi:hypothetical protein
MLGIQPNWRFMMKRVLLLTGVLVLLASSASCASLPKPKGDGNCLVIGNFVLDFPDGFFDGPSRKIESSVALNFLNVMTSRKFSILTAQGGFFFFRTDASDDFQLLSYQYKEQSGQGGYTIGETPLKIPIHTTSDKVIYIGHITVTYAEPTLYRESGSGGSSWNFKKSLTLNWDKDAVLAYILKKDPKSEWLKREVLEDKR